MKSVKSAMLALLGMMSMTLAGCAAGGLLQGLLGGGGGAAIAGTSPLGGAITSALPGGGSGLTPPTPGKVGGAGDTTAGSAVGQRVQQAAYELPIPFPYKPGTENGNLGCADVVCTALETAGVISESEHQLSVDGTRSLLARKGWQTIDPPPYQPGDVIIWGPTSGGTHKHIGILVIENGQVYAINNSSSQRKPVKVLLSSINRSVVGIMRAPGGAV